MARTVSSRSHPRVRTALVVEDDPIICRTLVELLDDEGFKVTTATDLRRAREALFDSGNPIGVLLLDLALPDGDGETVLSELSAKKDAPPTVVVSALHARAAQAAETYGLPRVAKPLDFDIVTAAVSVAFDNDIRPHAASGQPRAKSTRRFRAG
jgi:DNA-binding response OmpR family regulator